jgi:hypothetical protein
VDPVICLAYIVVNRGSANVNSGKHQRKHLCGGAVKILSKILLFFENLLNLA